MDVVLWSEHSQAPGETVEGLGAGVASKGPPSREVGLIIEEALRLGQLIMS